MKFITLTFLLTFTLVVNLIAAAPYEVKGLCLAAPKAGQVDEFVDFIDNDLANSGINLLILRIDYGYKYKSHPELVGNRALSKKDVKKLVRVCKANNIKIVPQINLLGHQSWASTPGKLLEVYPEFDETPEIKFPKEYKWPNKDGLYCKSYCPLHPKVHDVVFDLVDEICDVFETDAFHAGLDEVFYIGHKQCPRCNGRDKAELFAGEVTLIRNHLKEKNRELWMWGDRLLDGKTTGLGEWEASMNNTHRAIDMIPKDVIICDWHYERPDPTAVIFAAKGFSVLTCPWKNTANAVKQEKMMRRLIDGATPEMKPRYKGMIQTVWGPTPEFIKNFRGNSDNDDNSATCFKALINEWNR